MQRAVNASRCMHLPVWLDERVSAPAASLGRDSGVIHPVPSGKYLRIALPHLRQKFMPDISGFAGRKLLHLILAFQDSSVCATSRIPQVMPVVQSTGHDSERKPHRRRPNLSDG